LKDYNYASPGAHFVTVCTHDRECLFGEIVDWEMMLNESGLIVVGEWKRSSIIREEIEIGSFVVMPDHLHGIVIIKEKDADSNVGAFGRTPLLRGPAPKSLGSLKHLGTIQFEKNSAWISQTSFDNMGVRIIS